MKHSRHGFLKNTRDQLLEKEKTLKEDLASKGESMEASFKSSIKNSVVIGATLVVSYAAFKLLTINKEKKEVTKVPPAKAKKESKKKHQSNLPYAIAGFVSKSLTNYLINHLKNDSKGDL